MSKLLTRIFATDSTVIMHAMVKVVKVQGSPCLKCFSHCVTK